MVEVRELLCSLGATCAGLVFAHGSALYIVVRDLSRTVQSTKGLATHGSASIGAPTFGFTDYIFLHPAWSQSLRGRVGLVGAILPNDPL